MASPYPLVLLRIGIPSFRDDKILLSKIRTWSNIFWTTEVENKKLNNLHPYIKLVRKPFVKIPPITNIFEKKYNNSMKTRVKWNLCNKVLTEILQIRLAAIGFESQNDLLNSFSKWDINHHKANISAIKNNSRP